MQPFVVVIGIGALAVGATGAVVHKFRETIRTEKNIERGLKMVPMLIHLPPSSDDTEVGGRDVRDVM